VIQHLFGLPKVVGTKVYKIKHKETEIEDTIYSVFDFGEFGGTCEVTIAAEPQNLECSISILGSNGYIKIGGKALNIIESYKFLSTGHQKKFEYILENMPYSKEPNSYGSYQGSCPNHPEVYKNIDKFKFYADRNVRAIDFNEGDRVALREPFYYNIYYILSKSTKKGLF
jgi:predicted dehydrogenase